MTTHRAPEYSDRPGRTAQPRPTGRPVGRSVVAGLVLAVGAGAAWVAGMIYTLAGWSG
ncbi:MULTISPECIES: morphogenic membrane protein MmpA [Streptomyces]|uniref:morphogenic membrane protein MmpA n=1 Tax=Streptomyces TaxID=1883 RepID=UPI001CCF6E27|nr:MULTISPECIES: hypothetical protein [Streptomyces]MBZ6251413.1 hypothetical protein [Streptomyces olivaceus]MCU8595882.1 hypothetical protein [Streptomyces sp. A13(2022)]